MNAIADMAESLRDLHQNNTVIFRVARSESFIMDTYLFNLSPMYYVSLGLILAFGICGNTLNVLVLSRFSSQSILYVYLFWLAISDLIYLALSAVIYLLEGFSPNIMEMYTPAFAMCHLIFPLINVLYATSSFIITALMIDHRHAVYNPPERGTRTNRQRASNRIFWYFVLAAVIYIPVVFWTEVDEISYLKEDEYGYRYVKHTNTCRPDRMEYRRLFLAYTLIREVFVRVIPISAVILFNLRIVCTFRRHHEADMNLRHGTADEDDDRVTGLRRRICLMTIIALMFVLCTTPLLMLFLSTIALKESEVERWYHVVEAWVDVLLVLNASYKFYLYCCCSRAIRKIVLNVVRFRCNTMTQIRARPKASTRPFPDVSRTTYSFAVISEQSAHLGVLSSKYTSEITVE